MNQTKCRVHVGSVELSGGAQKSCVALIVVLLEVYQNVRVQKTKSRVHKFGAEDRNPLYSLY